MTTPTTPTAPESKPTEPQGATPPAPTDQKPTEPKAGEPPKQAGKPDDKTGKSDDKPLGPSGEKALHEEREARKALEKELKTYEPLKKLLAAISPEPTNGKTEGEQLAEKFAALEKKVKDAEGAQWRAEVAAEKGLTAAQAARLQGSTKEELAADADALKALFPSTPGTPQPDPSQGARTPLDIDAQIQDAQSKGEWRKVLQLQNQKLLNSKTN